MGPMPQVGLLDGNDWVKRERAIGWKGEWPWAEGPGTQAGRTTGGRWRAADKRWKAVVKPHARGTGQAANKREAGSDKGRCEAAGTLIHTEENARARKPGPGEKEGAREGTHGHRKAGRRPILKGKRRGGSGNSKEWRRGKDRAGGERVPKGSGRAQIEKDEAEENRRTRERGRKEKKDTSSQGGAERRPEEGRPGEKEKGQRIGKGSRGQNGSQPGRDGEAPRQGCNKEEGEARETASERAGEMATGKNRTHRPRAKQGQKAPPGGRKGPGSRQGGEYATESPQRPQRNPSGQRRTSCSSTRGHRTQAQTVSRRQQKQASGRKGEQGEGAGGQGPKGAGIERAQGAKEGEKQTAQGAKGSKAGAGAQLQAVNKNGNQGSGRQRSASGKAQWTLRVGGPGERCQQRGPMSGAEPEGGAGQGDGGAGHTQAVPHKKGGGK
ncbi:ribosome-binding protein 1-like [Asparagus officinalis]|uniref:ribosome-binding protein 1-like n=1 Tax=Asparagus officinalis TaxID=4686 RepID=UPI00098E3831|nr:ribosome-binding protein 1-like [Asparagus officinalis]